MSDLELTPSPPSEKPTTPKKDSPCEILSIDSLPNVHNSQSAPCVLESLRGWWSEREERTEGSRRQGSQLWEFEVSARGAAFCWLEGRSQRSWFESMLKYLVCVIFRSPLLSPFYVVILYFTRLVAGASVPPYCTCFINPSSPAHRLYLVRCVFGVFFPSYSECSWFCLFYAGSKRGSIAKLVVLSAIVFATLVTAYFRVVAVLYSLG